MNKITLLVFAWLSVLPVYGQEFSPLKTFSERSSQKWKAISQRTELEIAKINSPEKNQIAKVLEERLKFLEREFNSKNYLDDSVLQNRVDQVWARLISANTLANKPGQILISNSSNVNAFSFGEGTVIVNVGFLARIRNESQLAFALAHELAHYQLNHTLINIARKAEGAEDKEVQAALAKFKSGNVSYHDYSVIVSWMFTTTGFQRKQEIAADSLGFLLYAKAGYREDQAGELLKILDSAQSAKYHPGMALFNPLNFASFPFRQSWIKESKTHVVKDTLRETFLDSVRSHPHVRERLNHLLQISNTHQGKTYQTDSSRFQHAVIRAEYQCIQSSFENNRFDKSLFFALQLKQQYPPNKYAVTMIGRILLSLNIQRRNTTAHRFVPGSSQWYRSDLKAVINFLNNIDLRDLGEITFRFINLKGNFDAHNEEHYFILWKVCLFTDRWETAGKVRVMYRSKFPRGEYVEDMMTQ
ncbi:MAG: M48 family metalloprotease [Bacteroidetes bacterium]|nr:M48 family metalloprotease [Bacteroidota bacterium]MBS1540069.1 M48 family metalloprotease [Bacteroidota bacterium]